MKRYGYHRTSTREQHLDRGIKEITAYCEQNNLELEKIFTRLTATQALFLLIVWDMYTTRRR